MTTREAVNKVVAWMASNGVTQPPSIFEQKDFTPAIGFTPGIEVEWRGTSGKVQFFADEIAHWVADSNDNALQTILLVTVQAVLGLPSVLSLTWADYENPPAAPAGPLQVVGQRVPASQIALHESLDQKREYYEIANGAYPAEGSKYTAPDGKVYTVVAPTPFKRWLRI